MRQHLVVDNLVRQMATDGTTRMYVCDMSNTKPNGISHTAMPANPITDYNKWIEHIINRPTAPVRMYRWEKLRK